MSNPEETPEVPKNYESWNEGFKVGIEAGFKKAEELWRGRLHFRTAVAAIVGIYFIGMMTIVLGPTLWAMLAGGAITTFFFYVLDQTEELIKQGVGKLQAKLKERKLKKEKKDGDNDSSSAGQ